MNWITNWWNNWKKKAEDERSQYLREEFKVVERCGVLFLTHNGVAFEQIAADTPTTEIADK